MSKELKALCHGYDPFDVFDQYFSNVRYGEFIDQCMYVDIKTWLQDDILLKVDRMSMANSVEVRSPFLDHRLVEHVMPLQRTAKTEWGRTKIILKDATKSYLPKSIVKRKKQGFGAPTHEIGRFSISGSTAGGLFNSCFNLDPSKVDVTYKSLGLS